METWGRRVKPDRLRRIKLNLEIQSEHAILRIADTGQGMTEKAVEDFKQHGSSLSEVGSSGEKSYGLGLALVVDLCNSIKSEIDVKSELGIGTEFTIKLPILNS